MTDFRRGLRPGVLTHHPGDHWAVNVLSCYVQMNMEWWQLDDWPMPMKIQNFHKKKRDKKGRGSSERRKRRSGKVCSAQTTKNLQNIEILTTKIGRELVKTYYDSPHCGGPCRWSQRPRIWESVPSLPHDGKDSRSWDIPEGTRGRKSMKNDDDDNEAFFVDW